MKCIFANGLQLSMLILNSSYQSRILRIYDLWIIFFAQYSAFHSSFYWCAKWIEVTMSSTLSFIRSQKKQIHSFIHAENHSKNDQSNVSRGRRRENIARKIWIISCIKYEQKYGVIQCELWTLNVARGQ